MCVCVLVILISFWLVANFWHPVVMSLKYVKTCLCYLVGAASNIFAWDHNVTKSEACLRCVLPLVCTCRTFRLKFFFLCPTLVHASMMDAVSCIFCNRIHCSAALHSNRCFFLRFRKFFNIFLFHLCSSAVSFPDQVPLHNSNYDSYDFFSFFQNAFE